MLIIMDYATRYLEAIALCFMNVKTIAKELLKVFVRVGFPKKS